MQNVTKKVMKNLVKPSKNRVSFTNFYLSLELESPNMENVTKKVRKNLVNLVKPGSLNKFLPLSTL